MTSKTQGALLPIGVVFEDGAGNLVFQSAKIEPTKRGGRPKKILRDVALTLHFEYLCGLEDMKKGLAQVQVAQMFAIKDHDKVRSIVKKTRADILWRYPQMIFARGVGPDANGLFPGRMMVTYLIRDDGGAEGFAVYWARQEADYGRITFTSAEST